MEIFKLIRHTHPERKQFPLITVRFFNSSTVKFSENEAEPDGKPKGKITVMKRTLNPENRNNVLEYKSAASVIKRLNWENKLLFGPLMNPKNKTPDSENIIDTNQIIQHETQIPVIEPIIQYENIERQYGQICSSMQEIDLSCILTFPLENKLIHSTDKVNELNHLRKHLESLTKDSIPSVSTILQKTIPKERAKILDMWKQNMIKQLGEEGFQRYQRALLDNGSSLHNSISSFLSSTPESELIIREENIGHWNSLKKVLPNVKEVKLLEEFVMHPFLCYKGVVDCFAKYKDHLVVIDWKASKKAKTHIKDIYDNPLQIAAYVGALNFDPKFQYLAQKGMIVIAYESGNPATIHFFDKVTMKRYWSEWLKRIKQFWEMKNEETANV